MATDTLDAIVLRDALLEAATAASKIDVPQREEPAKEDSPNAKSYSRKTRPTHTAYQKAVMTRCAPAASIPADPTQMPALRRVGTALTRACGRRQSQETP